MLLIIVCLFGHTFEIDIPDHALTPEDYECMSALNIGRKQVERFFDGDYLIVLDHSLADKYSECWTKKMNFVNDKNEFNYDKFREYVVRDVLHNLGKQDVMDAEYRVRQAIDSCKNINEENLGRLGSKIYNCVVTAIHKF